VITEDGRDNLLATLDKILNLRLQTHLFYGYECETVYHQSEAAKTTTTTTEQTDETDHHPSNDTGNEKKEEQEHEHRLFILSKKDADALVEVYLVNLALEAAAKKFLQGDPNVFSNSKLKIDSMAGRGETLMRVRRWAEAENLFLGVLKTTDPTDEEKRRSLENLSYVLFKQHKYKPSEERLTELIELDTRNHDNSLILARDYENMGRVILAQKERYEDILEKYLKPAIDIITNLRGPDSEELSSVYRARAETILTRMRENKETETLETVEPILKEINEAIRIDRLHQNTESLIESLKGKYSALKIADPEEAQRSYTEAISQQNRMFGKQEAENDPIWKEIAKKLFDALLNYAVQMAIQYGEELAKAKLEEEKAKLQQGVQNLTSGFLP